jgi:hypothetical protein
MGHRKELNVFMQGVLQIANLLPNLKKRKHHLSVKCHLLKDEN